MNRPTEPEQILTMPAVERDAYAAEVCMQFHEEFDDTTKCVEYVSPEGNYRISIHGWQPSQPTEKGKAQCWDLADMFNLSVFNLGDGRFAVFQEAEGGLGSDVVSTNKQAAVVTAAILCALAEKEKRYG